MFESPAYLWGTAIGMYLWLGGISGGSFVTGAVADLLSVRTENEKRQRVYWITARIGMAMSFFSIAVGGLILLFHLGEPANVIYLWLFKNPASWMSIGVWVIIVMVLIALLQLLWLGFGKEGSYNLSLRRIDYLADFTRPRPYERLAISGVGAIMALVLVVYTALLLSEAHSVVPFWDPVLLPLLFLASGLSMGIAATVSITAIREGVEGTGVHEFSLADDVIILAELGVLAVFLFTLSGSTGAAAVSYERLTETYALEFWGGVVVVGLLLPLVLSALLIVIERFTSIHLSHRTKTATYLVKFGFVIIGGWVLRLAVLYSAWNIPIIGTV